jgi:hypothetical protein
MNVEQLSDNTLKQVCRSLGFQTRHSTRKDMLRALQHSILPESRPRKRRKLNHEKLQHSPRHLGPNTVINTHTRSRHLLFDKNITTIQRWWKKIYRTRKYVNDHDFLTLEPIDVVPFLLIEETGHVYQFHPHTLAKYFVQEGNLVNPFNRKPLNVIELKRLDKMVKKYDSTFLCLTEEQRRITLARSEEREHVRVCQLLHQDCVQIVGHLLRICGQVPRVPMYRVLFQLNQVIFPQYFHTFRQLYLLDYAIACESISHVITLIHHIWNDPLIASTKEACFVIESTLNTLTTFMTVILPALPIFLPEMLHSDAANDNVPIR